MKYVVFTCGQLQTNCVVVQSGNNCLVVDVPFGSNDVADYVLSNNLHVDAVLLTHGHFDHCGGVNAFLKSCHANAPVFVHQNDFGLCTKASKNKWGIFCEDCFPTHFLQQGRLQIGNFCLEVLETPAHTTGSVVFLTQDGVMLAGDTLFRGSVGRIDFPESVPQFLKSSLQKIASLKQNYRVICGHGPETTLNQEKIHNVYLRACADTK